jgi:hypothetical protein
VTAARCLFAAAALLLGGATAPMPVPRPGLPAPVARPVALRTSPVAMTAPEGAAVRVLSAHVLSADTSAFGGLSAVLAEPDGSGVLLLSDRGALFAASLLRQDGLIVGFGDAGSWTLRDTVGEALLSAEQDSEGLARLGEGFAVSFEGDHRIWRYGEDWRRARSVLPPDGIEALGINSGIEALAAMPDGTLLAIPERSGALERPFPVWRLRRGAEAWETGRWPRRPPFLVTGADIGPDGRLYVLERDFAWLGGWAMRLSRADLADWPDLRPETLVEWRRDGIDNMEGVSLWQADDGTVRALLVSDNNFHLLQRSLLIELAID